MTDTLYLDTETYSETPIKSGTYAYASDAEVMILTYAFNNGPVRVWDATTGEPIPEDLVLLLNSPDALVVAHNAMFDRNVLRLGRNVKIEVPIERWRCSMVRALAHALPGSLDKLCEILGIGEDQAKIKDGKKLIQLFCKPMPKNSKLRRATRETHPEQWARFIEYAVSDITAMREAYRLLPSWNYQGVELEHYHLDQKINDRGFLVDLELAGAALKAVDLEQARLKDQTFAITDGQVSSATKRDQLLDHIFEYYGIDLPDMQAATLQRRIDDPDLPEALRELLAIRLMATTTSTSKYKTLIKATNTDGRLRGTIQFDGASRTRRAAGRTFQPQNLPSRGLLPAPLIEAGIPLLKAGTANLVYDNIMLLTSSTIRGCIIAPPGKKLVVADLANIEGRDQAWLAGENWKLQAFRDFDAGTGFDLYNLAYAKSFGVNPADVTKKQRAIGKVQELALGYEGGVGAFMTFAAGYGIDLEQLSDQAISAIPGDILRESEDFYEWLVGKKKGNTFGLSRQAFIVCDSFKRSWRYAHPNITALWKELSNIVQKAINAPSRTFECRRFKVRRDGNWLRIGLPSGRALCYPSPQVDDSGGISYMGMHQYTRKWQRIGTHGGKMFENCIAEGVEVLTRRGWVAIQQVRVSDLVWDGVEWCQHSGVKHSGKQFVISAFGVRMTPEHLVLTTKGWRHASESEGHIRAYCGLPDSDKVPRQQWAEVTVGGSVRMRENHAARPERAEETEKTGDNSVVRVHETRYHFEEEHQARDVGTPCVRGVAINVGSVLATVASGLEKLRRAGDRSLPELGRILLEFLGRHGWNIPERVHAGSFRQRERVLSKQLRVENVEAPGEQQKNQCFPGHPERSDDCFRSRTVLRPGAEHASLPDSAGKTTTGSADSPTAAVYDILNCGARNRFVVRDSEGAPLIVHNCCQSLARDVLYDAMPNIEAAGYSIVLTVHDEVICEAPDDPAFNPDHLSSILSTNPSWAPDMPLAAAGFQDYRYKKE